MTHRATPARTTIAQANIAELDSPSEPLVDSVFLQGLACPSCGCRRSWVIDSRLSKRVHSIRRRRRCDNCQAKFTTYESIGNLRKTSCVTVESIDSAVQHLFRLRDEISPPGDTIAPTPPVSAEPPKPPAPTHCSDCRRPFSDEVRMYWIPGRPKQMCYQCARDYAGADDDDRPSRRDED